MAFTNNKYDNCAYQKDLTQSTSVLSHVIEKNRFINANQCRTEYLGVLQGNPVSSDSFNSKSSLVDIENELLGLGKQMTNCPEKKNKFCNQLGSGPKCTSAPQQKSCPTNLIKYKKKINIKQCDIKKYW